MKERDVRKIILNIIKVLIMIIFIVVISVSIFLAYLQFATFDIMYEPETIETFLEDSKIEEYFSTTGNSVNLMIPMNIVNTKIGQEINKMNLPEWLDINSVAIDEMGNRINFNATTYGFQMPFSVAFDYDLMEDALIIQLNDIRFGKEGIQVSDKRSKRILEGLFLDNLPIVIETSTLVNSEIIKINDIIINGENCQSTISIDGNKMMNTLARIKGSANEELLEMYKASDDITKLKAVEYIDNVEFLKEKDVEYLIKDILSKGPIVREILLLSDMDQVDEVFAIYGDYLNYIDKEDIMEEKTSLLSDILNDYYHQIFQAFYSHYFIDDIMYINRGIPYTVVDHEYITLEKVSTEQGINIPENTLSKLEYYYDITNDELKLAYEIDEDNYLIISEDGFENIPSTELNNHYNDTGMASYVEDIETWNNISTLIKEYFQTEKIYIRFMKADNQYAFVITSPDYSYQNYWVFALEKRNSSWEFLMNVNTLVELNKAYPEFNLEIVTDEIDKVIIYNLEEDMMNTIVEDMINRNLIKSSDNADIEYCSYGHSYIGLKMSNGNEYVYKVENMFLDAVYQKNVAMSYWNDIPEIIVLQDEPIVEE